MKHLQAKDLLEILQANPEMYIKVAETKKHDDTAPTMAVVWFERCFLENADEEVILLCIEPNQDTILASTILDFIELGKYDFTSGNSVASAIENKIKEMVSDNSKETEQYFTPGKSPAKKNGDLLADAVQKALYFGSVDTLTELQTAIDKYNGVYEGKPPNPPKVREVRNGGNGRK